MQEESSSVLDSPDERAALLERLRDALVSSTEEGSFQVAHVVLPLLLQAAADSPEAIDVLVSFLKELLAALPSTSAAIDLSFGTEVAGVTDQDLVLPPGPVSALQELLLDAFEVAWLLLSDEASSEAKAADVAVQSKNKEAAKAKQEAEEAARAASKSKASDDQAKAETLRQASVRINEELSAARQEQSRTRPEAGLTPHTARLKLLLQFLGGLQDVLPAALIKVRIDGPALVPLGLAAPNRSTLETRARTQKYYKQQYFNLLREESEGYAKLVVELLSSMGPPHDSATGLPSESTEVCDARAQVVMNNIKSLIGYFDLHPHRTLDIVLDVFSDHVVSHHVFFRRLLALSPWADRTPTANTQVIRHVEEDKGSQQIAAILGFKFQFYQMPEGPSEMPYRLFFMTAILIWDGLVAMSDLYPHLSLSDEALQTAQDAQLRASKGKAKSRMNALAMAGALDGSKLGSTASSTAPTSKSTAAETPKKDPPNQKLSLAAALVSIGDLQHALFILSRFPYLFSASASIADDLLRIADVVIEPAYRALPLTWRRTSPSSAAEAKETDTSGQRRPRWSVSEKKLIHPSAPRTTLSAYAFTRSTAEAPMVFFFPEWRDRLPKPATREESIEQTLELMRYIGPLAARNLRFFHKLIRIGADAVKTAVAEGDRDTRMLWRDVLRMHILPGVSLAEPNTGLAFALWQLLAHYSYEERFSMYGEWASASYSLTSILREKQSEAEQESKSILKRLSSDNTRQSARAMAKIAHSNPCIFFGNAINQIQSYQNMIGPVVESARYLSDVGYDVITYVLIESLSRDKDRTKADGTNTADWLINLSDFVGQLYRRYEMPLEPILRYILAQIQRDNVQDLVVFRSLLGDMTETRVIDPLTVSDDQVRLLAGSNLLRNHVMTSLVTEAQVSVQDRKLNVKALKRWKDQVASTAFCQQLVVRIALCRQQCVDRMSEPEASSVQSMASIYDQTALVLFQLTDYLEMQHLDTYDQRVPPLWELIERFGIDQPIAFHLARPTLRREMASLPAAVAKWTDSKKEQNELDILRQKVQAAQAARAAKQDATAASTPASSAPDEVRPNGTSAPEDVEMQPALNAKEGETESAQQADRIVTDQELAKPDTAAAIAEKEERPKPEEEVADFASSQTEVVVVEDTDAMAVDLAEREERAKQEEAETKPDEREPYLEWLKQSMRFDGGHTPLWYLTFWSLKLYDIFAPVEGYTALAKMLENAAPNLQTQIFDLEDKSKLPPIGQTEQQKKDYSRDLKKEVTKLRGSLPRIAERVPVVKKDEKEQKDHVARVLARMERERGDWVLGRKTTQFSRYLVNNCIRFRAPLSPVDSLYCGHLVLLLHRIGTPDFNLMWTCEQIFSDNLTAIAASLTEQEARNYAFFLSIVFGQLRRWAQDEKLYQKEAIGEGEVKLPGMLETSSKATDDAKHWTHDRFQRVVYKFESRLRNSLKICLNGPLQHARNALRILIQLIDVFPIHATVGNELETLAKALTSKDAAIKVLAEGYIAMLNKREPTWAKTYSTQTLSAKAAPFAPTKASTPEPRTPAPPQGAFGAPPTQPKAAAEKAETSTKTDAAISADNLPPRPVHDPNWREKEADKKTVAAAEERSKPPAPPERPAAPSRQASHSSRAATPPPPATGNLRDRLSKPLGAASASRSREADRQRDSDRSSVLAPRDDRPPPRSREDERDGPMAPPAAPSGPRISDSPRRPDVSQSPRAPRADREREREQEPKRPASRAGTPDSAHSSSHRSSQPRHRADTPVEGSTSSKRDDRDREQRHSRRSDRDRDEKRSSRSSRHSDRDKRDGDRDRHRDRDRSDRDRKRESDSKDCPRESRSRSSRNGEDEIEPDAKRRRTDSPNRDRPPAAADPPRPTESSSQPPTGPLRDAGPSERPQGFSIRGRSNNVGTQVFQSAMATAGQPGSGSRSREGSHRPSEDERRAPKRPRTDNFRR